jgi:hypothetical protein
LFLSAEGGICSSLITINENFLKANLNLPMEDEEEMIQRLIRKVSVLLIFSVMASTLIPIVSYASSVMQFIYRPATQGMYSNPELTGYVYTRDPSSVSVRANNGSSVTQVTYRNIYSGYLYDDNNTPYYNINYKFVMGQAPSSLSVGLEGTTYNLSGILNPDYPGVYSYTSDISVTLGTYRMPGQFLMPTDTAATYLPAGSEIASFTPAKIGNDVNVIDITLPHVRYTGNTLNSDLLASDFEIKDLSVNEAVYTKRLSYQSNGFLTFVMETPLVQGHEYMVKLSSSSSGNEIMLPIEGIYTTKVAVSHWVGNYPSGYASEDNSVYFRNLIIGNPVVDTPTDPPSDPYVPPAPPVVSPPSNKDQVIVNEESLKNGTKDKVAVDIAGGKKQVLLPVKASEMVGDRKLELKNDQLTVVIPPEVLKKLQSLIPAGQLEGANIAFSFDKVTEEDMTKLLNKAKVKSKSELKAAGDVYDFKLSVVSSDGKETVLSQFDKAITLRLKVHAGTNPALLGIYYIADDGKLEYAGGKLIDGEIVADVTHFSKYAVLEYDKTFTDVSNQYWAFDEIKELSAKHIISGISDSEFAPQKQMTRAEFAALIARTLDLKASKAVTFTDVDSGNVHADAIAAASEAGIIHGRNAETFAPDDRITREEMVTLIISAYEYKTGKKIDLTVESSYADRNLAAKWALPYIDAASSIGFVQGQGNGTFAPKKFMTRAEGAQLIYRLLKI